jgi:hypothetical protein
MKASLGCKYTAVEALQALNRLYVMMHENTPGDPMPMLVSWWLRLLCCEVIVLWADGAVLCCAAVFDNG